MKTSLARRAETQAQLDAAFRPMPTYQQIRDYAHHLYEESGCIPGRDLDNWLEAEACLMANIPPIHSRSRLHRHLHAST